MTKLKQPLSTLPLWKNKNRLPYNFSISLTPRCNNNCVHCYINEKASSETIKKIEVSFDAIKEIASQAVSLGSIWCTLTGGEPLLREDFFDIYLFLKKQGFLVSVFTNASLITKKHITLFKKYPPKEIEVSIYGITKNTYEKVSRVKGSHKAFMRGVKLLLENNLPVTLKAVLLKSNLHEFQEIQNFCELYSKGPFRYDPFLHLRTDGNIKKNNKIRSERISGKDCAYLEQLNRERFSKFKKLYYSLVDKNKHIHPVGCNMGEDSFHVNYKGEVQLCQSLCFPKAIYSLKKGKLQHAWEKFFPKIKRMCFRSKKYKEGCGKCKVLNLCSWCPAFSYLENGTLDNSIDAFCEIANKRASVLGVN